jgi:hypothetical protein
MQQSLADIHSNHLEIDGNINILENYHDFHSK